MMEEYNCRQYGRQAYSFLTLRIFAKDVQALSDLANKYGLPRHTLLTRSLKRGLPEVIAALEAKRATNNNNDQG